MILLSGNWLMRCKSFLVVFGLFIADLLPPSTRLLFSFVWMTFPSRGPGWIHLLCQLSGWCPFLPEHFGNHHSGFYLLQCLWIPQLSDSLGGAEFSGWSIFLAFPCCGFYVCWFASLSLVEGFSSQADCSWRDSLRYHSARAPQTTIA